MPEEIIESPGPGAVPAVPSEEPDYEPSPVTPLEVIRESEERHIGPDAEILSLYHGTVSDNLEGIFEHGLHAGSYLSNDMREAYAYGEEKAREVGSIPVVVSISLSEPLFGYMEPDSTLWGGGEGRQNVPPWMMSMQEAGSARCGVVVPMESMNGVSLGETDDWKWRPMSEAMAYLRAARAPFSGRPEGQPVFAVVKPDDIRLDDPDWWEEQLNHPINARTVEEEVLERDKSGGSPEDMAENFARGILEPILNMNFPELSEDQIAVGAKEVEKYLESVREVTGMVLESYFEEEVPGSDRVTALRVIGRLMGEPDENPVMEDVRVFDEDSGTEVPEENWPFSMKEAEAILWDQYDPDDDLPPSVLLSEEDREMVWDVMAEAVEDDDPLDYDGRDEWDEDEDEEDF